MSDPADPTDDGKARERPPGAAHPQRQGLGAPRPPGPALRHLTVLLAQRHVHTSRLRPPIVACDGDDFDAGGLCLWINDSDLRLIRDVASEEEEEEVRVP